MGWDFLPHWENLLLREALADYLVLTTFSRQTDLFSIRFNIVTKAAEVRQCFVVIRMWRHDLERITLSANQPLIQKQPTPFIMIEIRNIFISRYSKILAVVTDSVLLHL